MWKFASIITLSLLFGCVRRSQEPLKPAFYYWQTTLALSGTALDYLASSGCRKIYVKALDVGLDPADGSIAPYSRLVMADTAGLSQLEVVPVVFITNETIRRLTDDEKTGWLAEKIASALVRAGAAGARVPRPEFQVDCDWTQGTREAFFRLLEKTRGCLPEGALLSATIRLHQYKFPEQTGVPPADRGMLMLYNTGDIDAPDETNSIFKPEDANKYLKGAPASYPLPLDVALPAFSWTLVFRDGELWKILPGHDDRLPTGTLERGTFQNGHYLRPGDFLRQEVVSPELLRESALLAAGAHLADDATIAFFHLDNHTPRAFPAPLIRTVCQLADSVRTAQ
ncbi:MAG: hypothetical protein ACKOCO_09695 [Bacteroidota bacterium]